MDENIRLITESVTTAELWGQLAEEAAELAQAALKMQRLLSENNRPRKTAEECIDSVIEEHADVALCFKILGWDDKGQRKAIMERKAARWAELIRERKG